MHLVFQIRFSSCSEKKTAYNEYRAYLPIYRNIGGMYSTACKKMANTCFVFKIALMIEIRMGFILMCSIIHTNVNSVDRIYMLNELR